MYFTYILYSKTHDKYYVGSTNDIAARLARHNNGYEKYTKMYIPWNLIWFCEKSSRADAVQLELKLKNLSKTRIKQLIEKYTGPHEGRDEK